MCRMQWEKEPDDGILAAKGIEFRGEVAIMTIEDEETINPNCSASCMFIKDFRKPLITEVIVSPAVFT